MYCWALGNWFLYSCTAGLDGGVGSASSLVVAAVCDVGVVVGDSGDVVVGGVVVVLAPPTTVALAAVLLLLLLFVMVVLVSLARVVVLVIVLLLVLGDDIGFCVGDRSSGILLVMVTLMVVIW